MATIPTAAPSPSLGFQPAFKRVAQSGDFDDCFACVAMIAQTTLEEVKATAIKLFNHPKHPPYWVSDELINKLFAHYGLVSTVWKAVATPISGLPDVAILSIEYDESLEFGRAVVFHRMRPTSGPKPVIEYVLDPAHWLPPQQQTLTDLKAIAPAWYIGVHKMNAMPLATKK